MKGSEIQSNSLRRDVAAAIIESIQQQSLVKGARLSERELGKQLGLSRTPVRVALTLLAERGIVELRPGVGWFVDKPPRRSAADLIPESGDKEDLVMRIMQDRFRGITDNHFSEADFIKRYDVMRGDLRKALIQLSQDGMVERSLGRGWHFMPMLDNVRAQRASYDFRIAVETSSLLCDTYEVNRARLERVKAEHQRLISSGLSRTKRTDLFDINADFHLMLTEFSGNEFFVQAIAHQNRLRRVIEYFVQVPTERLIHSLNDHLAIIDAIEQGDPKWAASLMERHLTRARDKLLSSNDKPAA